MNQTLSVFVILLVVVIATLGAHVEAQKGLAESLASGGGGGANATKRAPAPSSTKVRLLFHRAQYTHRLAIFSFFFFFFS